MRDRRLLAICVERWSCGFGQVVWTPVLCVVRDVQGLCLVVGAAFRWSWVCRERCCDILVSR